MILPWRLLLRRKVRSMSSIRIPTAPSVKLYVLPLKRLPGHPRSIRKLPLTLETLRPFAVSQVSVDLHSGIAIVTDSSQADFHDNLDVFVLRYSQWLGGTQVLSA